ncbi:T9SS type A sorting domain-containing protein [Marinoscillum furvescens]|nr:T9SS type A sorting domain-containing protein [Marinoscillum furvescens]
MRYSLLAVFVLLTLELMAQKVKLNVNLNVKHRTGNIESFDRHKFVNFHSTVNQNNWNTNNKMDNVIGDLLRDRDVHIGRNTGTISWYLRNSITEDPNRPGYADLTSIAAYGKQNRDSYARATWAHPYEDQDEQILCTQVHPFYPDGKTTNKGWAFSQADTEEEPFGTASGEFLAHYIKEFYGTGGVTGKPKPKFVEVTNEPLWDLVTTAEQPHDLTKIFKFHGTVAREIHKLHSDVQVGGYCAAFPDFDKNNFQRWHQRDKHFIDVAGEDMDFWTIHLYDFPSFGGKSLYRKGSNMEATLDMLEQYSMLKFGEVKPTMISEYNAQTHDYNKQGHLPYVYWLKVKSSVAMMMQFMERADKINYAMPFFMLKAEWQYNPSVGPTSVHGSRMMRRENEPESYTGDFIYTEAILLYDLLKDIDGTRVDTYSSNPDMMVDAYVDGNKAYVMIHNLDVEHHELDLNLAGISEEATDVEVRHLFLNGSTANDAPLLNVTNSSGFDNALEIAPEGSYVLVFTYPSEINIDEEVVESKYYADTYLKEIAAEDPIAFKIDQVELAAHGEAVLRVGVGRDHGRSLKPTITVNGTRVAVPDNFRGLGQEDRANFFGVLEIPIPYSVLQAHNTVEVTFPDAGGHVSTVTMQVFNFSAELREVVTKTNGLGLNIKIQPNPVQDRLLVTGMDQTRATQIDLVNIQGKLVYQQTGIFDELVINTQSLDAGMYFLKAQIGDQVQATKVLIAK